MQGTSFNFAILILTKNGILKDKNVVVVGVANQHSIATGIARSMHREGANLAFTYQNDRLLRRVSKIAESFNSDICLPCDLALDADIEALAAKIGGLWQKVDALVHAVGFAPADELKGSYIEAATRDGHKIAHDISSYSFTALCKYFASYLNRGAGVLTLSYLGSQKSLPNYNVMGMAKASLEASVRYLAASLGPFDVRVNAISSGPIRTLAASGVGEFRRMLAVCEKRSPLGRNVDANQVGDVAAFLCSPLARAITGEIIYADAGFRTAAMSAAEMEIS